MRSFQTAKAMGVKIRTRFGHRVRAADLWRVQRAGTRGHVQYGMTPSEAISAATMTRRRAVGLSHVLGTVEPGKLADLLVLRKDPTVDPMVVHDGANLYLTFCDGRLTVQDGVFMW